MTLRERSNKVIPLVASLRTVVSLILLIKALRIVSSIANSSRVKVVLVVVAGRSLVSIRCIKLVIRL